MSNKGKIKSHAPSSGWIGLFGVVEAVLDKFGWPGALLIFAGYFIENNATQEQKHTIIDMYVLGKGINFQYPMIILGGTAVLAFLAQWGYYHKKMNLMKEEVKRLADWKTKYQERRVGGPLHHSEDPEE